jgi:hypothetical protein
LDTAQRVTHFAQGKSKTMTARTERQKAGDISRAIRNVQRVLLRNDLNPFELLIEIREVPGAGEDDAYLLRISTSDRSAAVQRNGIPRQCIESAKGDNIPEAFGGLIEALVPELLEGIKYARNQSQPIAAR